MALELNSKIALNSNSYTDTNTNNRNNHTKTNANCNAAAILILVHPGVRHVSFHRVGQTVGCSVGMNNQGIPIQPVDRSTMEKQTKQTCHLQAMRKRRQGGSGRECHGTKTTERTVEIKEAKERIAC